MARIPEHFKLEQMYEWASNYHEDQLFIGLSCLKPKSIKIITNELAQKNAAIDSYITILESFSRDFPLEYATNDNNCFKDDKEKFKHLRGAFKFLNDFILRCCPRSPYSAYDYKNNHITYSNPDHSYVCSGNAYQLDLYGRESFPEPVRQLCAEFECFFGLMARADELCQNVIQQEERIRNNPLWSFSLYNEAYEEEADICMDTVKTLKECKDVELVDKFEEARKAGVLDDKIYSYLYHALNKREFHNHVISSELGKARALGLQDEEKILFKDMSIELILQRRYVAQNFDKIATTSRGNTLSSECIAFLIEWNGVAEGKARLYLKYFKNNYQGSHIVPTYSAVSYALKNKLGRGSSMYRKAYEDFASKLDGMLLQFSSYEKKKMAQASVLSTGMFAVR